MWLLLLAACKGPGSSNPTDTAVPVPSCRALPPHLGVPIGVLEVDAQRTGVELMEGAGTATVTAGFSLATDGATVLELPATVWIGADSRTTGTLTVERLGCPAITIELQSHLDPGLSAVLLPTSPGHSWVNAFGSGATVRAAIDPGRWPQLEGTVDVYRIEHGGWQQGALVDVRGAPTTVDVAGLTLVELGSLEVPPSTPVHHDLVIDVDRNGRFDPGDFLDGAVDPGLTSYPDLSAPGPHVTTHAEISAGFFRTQRVFWPVGLDVFESPRPVVVISHGNGHQYDWYDDLQQHLASWGYVVMSHRSDTEPGIASAATTLLDNTDLFLTFPEQVHADLEGRIDPTQVVWIGHSRGGEAVALGAERLRNNGPMMTLSIDALQLVSSIAPTVFNSPNISNPGDLPYHQLLGGADGDVTQGPITPGLPFRCELCKSPRLLQGNTGPQAVHYVQGAIHNDFNCCGVDDGFGVQGPKIGRQAAAALTRGLYVALLGHHLQHDPHILEFVTRLPGALPLPDTGQPVSVLHIPARDKAFFLEDFQSEPDGAISSSGTAVVHDLDAYTEAVFRDNNISYAYAPNDPMNGMTQSEGEPGIAERGAVFSFERDVSWEVALSDGIRVQHRFLSVRVAQSTRHPITVALDDALSFSIALVHSDGETVLPTASYGLVPAPYRRGGAGPGRGWANEFNTVRIPLVDFETAGADLGDVVGVRLLFGPSWGSAQGRVAFDDLVLE